MSCKCLVTQGQKCIDCGRQVYETETRECGECKHFKLDLAANVLGTCKPKLMTVTSTMRVTFKNPQGTCFERK